MHGNFSPLKNVTRGRSGEICWTGFNLTEHWAKPLGLPTISLPSFRFGRYNGAAEGGNEDETDSFACGSVLVGDGEGFGSNAQVLGSTLNLPLPNSVLSQFLLSAIV